MNQPSDRILTCADIIKEPPWICVLSALHDGRHYLHRHEFYEMIYIANGFTMHQLDGKVNLLVTGDIFFIKPGESHAYLNAFKTQLYNILFLPDELGTIRDELSLLGGLDKMLSPDSEIPPLARILHVPINERRNIEAMLEKMAVERDEKNLGWEISMKSRLTSFLLKYARMYAEAPEKIALRETVDSEENYYGHIRKVLRHIELHYGENITMNELAEVTGLSPDYMTRKFKSILAISPSEYLRKYRISKAMELLYTTDLTISEISSKTGFSDVAHFSRVFKQNAGVSPVFYRKNHNE